MLRAFLIGNLNLLDFDLIPTYGGVSIASALDAIASLGCEATLKPEASIHLVERNSRSIRTVMDFLLFG